MNKLRKSLFTLLLAGVLSGSLFAQVMNESVNLNAKATILTSLSITKDVDLNFGNISATTPGIVHLMPNGSASNYAGNNPTTGKLTINGANDGSVLISFPAGVILEAFDNETEPNKVGELPFSIHVYGYNENLQGSSLPLNGVGMAGVNVNRILNGSTGKYFLYVGGSLGGNIGSPAKLNNQPMGEYTGSVMFEVKYN